MNIKRDNKTGIINEEAPAMEIDEKELFIQSDLKIIINDENHNNKENFKLLEFDFESIFLKDNEKIIKKKSFDLLLTGIDLVLVCTIVLLSIVGFWRGLFQIILYYCEIYHLYFIYFLGSIIHVQFALARDAYDKYFAEKTNFFFLILKIIYTYIFGVCCIFQWAGLWYLLDEFLGYDVFYTVSSTLFAATMLITLKVFRNVLAPPYAISTDIPEYMFQFRTMFRTDLPKKGAGETSLYILDCFFSVFVVGSLVVFVWRGAWVLTDCFCYPDDDNLSAIGSLIIGYAIVIVTFSLQTPMKRLCEKLTGFWRILVVDLYIGFSFIGTINLWRGIWNLLNLYFLPESPAMSCWITHLGCFVFLVLINCSNSVLVRGVYIDAEEEGGKCVVFPTYYLRFFIQERRKKKIQKNQKNHTRPSILSKEEFEKCEKISKELSVNHNDVKCHVTVDLPPESGS